MLINRFAHTLKYYRQKHDYTQQQIADLLNISRSVVAKWEGGHVLPDLRNALKLSQLFQITLDEFVGTISMTDDLLSDYQAHYGSETYAEQIDFDDESFNYLIDFIIKHPTLRQQLIIYMSLSIKQQKSAEHIFATVLDEISKH